ncbi:rhodanese-related sulfurtransferase [Candidatus Nomurabacteria bacterium]|nr:rhodanese-related sulfurtransferase [Candidatus Nomurabacteria bacterium]
MYKKVNTKSKEELLQEIAEENFSRKTLSFYKYVKIADPKAMRDFLFDKFSELKCLGRIYVAHEGINAQLNVPEPNWQAFDKFIQSVKEFSGVPYKIAVEEKGKSSFLKLIVKVRPKIVADGLDDATFDPADTGEYADAEEVNKMIDRGVTVIDMRNMYEAAIGHFEGAKIMNVDTFREQLSKVHDMFRDKKDEEVLLYCTGGIRCEKASAWMKHNGFKNVKHIRGGIIDYAHRVKEQGLQNKFRGKNFVFDERLGEKVGDEIISDCQVCEKTKCDDYFHCKNESCHVLFICCVECKEKLKGYCGKICMICDKFPRKLNQFLVGPNKQKHKNQFKKHYKKLKIQNQLM